ncbi:hypothetical protein EBM89_06020 [Cellulomonas triticagri]|uniref:Uncharacterized protein n=1 Tax=Cellulomonas triticagri TaxID=2483352 RepID=A0A3M2JLD9_9CELL|nr:hypothetical protein EBM89_06020 [Cellulomonas triticagri]
MTTVAQDAGLAARCAPSGECGQSTWGSQDSQSQRRALAGETRPATASSACECRRAAWADHGADPCGRLDDVVAWRTVHGPGATTAAASAALVRSMVVPRPA